VKRATIVDEEGDTFSLEYDTTVGTRNVMRLDAGTYDAAIREAKTFLGITEDRDEDGNLWEFS